MKDTKLNNLLDIKELSEKEFLKKNPTTKRTDVANDILKENAYVEGKDVFKDSMKSKEEHKSNGLNNLISLDDFTKNAPSTEAKPTKRTEVAKDVIKENAYVEGKDVFKDSMKSKEVHNANGLSNLISFSDFSKETPNTTSKSTKRTDVAKDVLLEKKLKAKEKDCDDKKVAKCDDDEEEKPKGLTAAQKRLPEHLQKAILKRQGK